MCLGDMEIGNILETVFKGIGIKATEHIHFSVPLIV